MENKEEIMIRFSLCFQDESTIETETFPSIDGSNDLEMATI